MKHNGALGRLEDVHKSFGEKVALDGLSLEAHEGELIALLGPNGAGKTTAISILLGLLEADAGAVTLFGGRPRDLESRRNIGVMLQEQHLQRELKARELLDVVTSYYPNPYTPQEAMEITGISALSERRYGKLSGGLKRQVEFALSICGRPKLLFLDEPTAGLDVESREMLWKTIRELVSRGTAIILTTHYLEEAEHLADRIVMLANGRIVGAGTVNEMRAMVPRKSISCCTSADIDEIKTWPTVVEVDVSKDRQLNLIVSDAEDVARRLLAADPSLRDLEIRRAGLADAFRALTKGAKQ